jgi:lipid-A-disaccharide synthase
MPEPVNIIITVNSPGEVAGWLKPAVKAIKALAFPTSITVVIPPCTFASGGEIGVVRSLPEVDRAFGPRQFIRYILFGGSLPGFKPGPTGLVLFLGGDLTYAMLLSKRLNYPAIAYTEGLATWTHSFARFATPYPKMGERILARGVPERQLRVIGNLMLDAIRPRMTGAQVRQALGIGARPLLLMMPGSRPAHFEYMIPFLLQVAEDARKTIPDLAIAFSISTFITEQHLKNLNGPFAKLFGQPSEYIPGQALEDGVADDCATSGAGRGTTGFIKTKDGTLIPAWRGCQYELMAAANVAISLPGTNTFELAACGIPMIVVVVLNYPERIPLEGIAGIIGNIPVIGREFKRRLLPKILAKVKYTAWPNRLAQAYVVPEIHGVVSTEAVSAEVVRLLSDSGEHRKMVERLKSMVGDSGAADRLAQLVREVLQEKYGTLTIED